MSLEAEALLKQLADGHTRGSFAQACWGSSFYTITEKGLIDANPS